MTDSILLNENDIASIVSKLNDKQLRSASELIARRAIQLIHFTEPDVIDVLESTSDVQEKRNALLQLSHAVEEPYLQAQENDENINEDHALKQAFLKARAIQSVYYSLGAAREDSVRSIYEAHHAGVAQQQIESVIHEQ